MKTSNHNQNTLIIVLVKLSIFFLLCIAIVNAPHVKGQTNPIQVPIIHAKQQEVRQIYSSQIGIREKQANRGAEVEKYLRYVNLPKGNPWCAAFVCWVFGQANVENPKTGWSPDLFKGSKVIWDRAESRKLKAKSWSGESGTSSQEPRHSRIAYAYPTRQTTGNRQPDSYRVTTPGTGDIFGLFFPEMNRIAHAGFIDQWLGDWLITVEGNTNDPGAREGDGVYRKRRAVKSIYQVARYIPQP